MNLQDAKQTEYLEGASYSESFRNAWQNLEHSFFKFELLQNYHTPDDKALKFFLNGDIANCKKEIAKQIGKQVEMYKTAKDRDVLIQRIRLVNKPISQYVQYEILSYLESQKYGEEIFLLNEQYLNEIGETGLCDFVLFDEKKSFYLDYDSNGSFKGSYYTENKEVASKTSDLFVKMRKKSISLNEFIKANRDEIIL